MWGKAFGGKDLGKRIWGKGFGDFSGEERKCTATRRSVWREHGHDYGALFEKERGISMAPSLPPPSLPHALHPFTLFAHAFKSFGPALPPASASPLRSSFLPRRLDSASASKETFFSGPGGPSPPPPRGLDVRPAMLLGPMPRSSRNGLPSALLPIAGEPGGRPDAVSMGIGMSSAETEAGRPGLAPRRVDGKSVKRERRGLGGRPRPRSGLRAGSRGCEAADGDAAPRGGRPPSSSSGVRPSRSPPKDGKRPPDGPPG